MADKIGTLGDRIANRIVRHFPWQQVVIETKVPIVSFTFDDAPKEAGSIGASVLEDHGARGTFYISGRLAGEESNQFLTAAECETLAQRGHEIASHTFEHRKISRFDSEALMADLARNDLFLQEIAPIQTRRNFAFPYGMASPRHRKALSQTFRTSRSVLPGINRGLTDISNLAGVELRPEQSYLDIADAALEDVMRQPGWLVFFTHDVSDKPSKFGCHTDVFRVLVGRAQSMGAAIMTVDAAADHLNLPE